MYKYRKDLSEEERISQNITNLLEADKGAVAYDRDLGVDPEWKDQPDGMYDAMMLSEMTDLVNEKEPRGTTTLEIGDDDELEVNIEIAELN